MEYETENKSLVLDCLKRNEGVIVSANYIYKELIDRGVSLTSVYRELNRLLKNRTINLVKSPLDKEAHYLYIAQKNTDLKAKFVCIHCGSATIIDCADMRNFMTHIDKEHNFTIDLERTVFYGLCLKCKKELNNATK